MSPQRAGAGLLNVPCALEMRDVEARSRMLSVLSVIEHELSALEALEDERLAAVLRAITVLRAEIVGAIASLEQPEANGRLA